MRVTVLTGCPGAGKTYRRQHDEKLRLLPVADISEVYENVPGISWDGALSALMVKAQKLLLEHREIVIEGLFLEGTPSRRILERELRDMQVDAGFILVHRPYYACKGGVMSSGGNRGARLRILDRYWKRADATARKEKP